MKNIAVIPARGGSKRLPGKNLLPLGGMSLLAHSIAYALANPEIIDAVVVSTDDDSIKEEAIRLGAIVIDRPIELAGDHEPTVTAVAHVLKVLGESVENIILLQPTNPLRPKELLARCFDSFVKSGRQSLFTVSRNREKLGKIENDRFHPFNYEPGQRSQDLDPLFSENGLVYISTSACIKSGKIISDDAFPFITDENFPILDIDTAEDFDYAVYLFDKQKHNESIH